MIRVVANTQANTIRMVAAQRPGVAASSTPRMSHRLI